ncbi:LOW QUALITY PROTEIN: uncharacterized protein ACNLHF_024857 [Anomaloglossus baeobatrachus]
MSEIKSMRQRKRPHRNGEEDEPGSKRRKDENNGGQEAVNRVHPQRSKKSPRLSPALFCDNCEIQPQQLHQLLKYAAIGKRGGATQASWCTVHHQKRLRGVLVVVLQDLAQHHFYQYYSHFRSLRRLFRHVRSPNTENYIRTNCTGEPTDSSPLFGLDCEMCLTCKGHELSWVSLVDAQGQCIMDELVKPDNLMITYKTRLSRITKKKLTVKTKLKDVQERIKALLPPDAVLVGHSLENDLRALQMIHPNVIDTSILFARNPGRRFRLKFLAQVILKREIQRADANGHDPSEDAVAVLNLAQYVIQHRPEKVADINLEEIKSLRRVPWGEARIAEQSFLEELEKTGQKITYVSTDGSKNFVSSGQFDTLLCASNQEVLEKACSMVPLSPVSIVTFQHGGLSEKCHVAAKECFKCFKDLKQNMSPRVDTERIISAVERHPVLWDTRIEGYRDRLIVERAREDVAQELFPNNGWERCSPVKRARFVDTVRRRWRSARDQYRREFNPITSSSLSSRKRRYVYFSNLDFLRPIMEVTQTDDNLDDYDEQPSAIQSASATSEAEVDPYVANTQETDRPDSHQSEHQTTDRGIEIDTMDMVFRLPVEKIDKLLDGARGVSFVISGLNCLRFDNRYLHLTFSIFSFQVVPGQVFGSWDTLMFIGLGRGPRYVLVVQRMISGRTLDYEDVFKEMGEDPEAENTIYVSGFPKPLMEEFLQNRFNRFKEIKSIFVPTNENGRQRAKYCYLRFHSPKATAEAVRHIQTHGGLRTMKAITSCHLHRWLQADEEMSEIKSMRQRKRPHRNGEEDEPGSKRRKDENNGGQEAVNRVHPQRSKKSPRLSPALFSDNCEIQPQQLHQLLKYAATGKRGGATQARLPSASPNLKSAREHPDVIRAKLAKEVALGRFRGPFQDRPFRNLRVCTLGVVPKKERGQYRLIHHLSYPKGRSVNDGIPEEDSAAIHMCTGLLRERILDLVAGVWVSSTSTLIGKEDHTEIIRDLDRKILQLYESLLENTLCLILFPGNNSSGGPLPGFGVMGIKE